VKRLSGLGLSLSIAFRANARYQLAHLKVAMRPRQAADVHNGNHR
jgi:hypothetical protein